MLTFTENLHFEILRDGKSGAQVHRSQVSVSHRLIDSSQLRNEHVKGSDNLTLIRIGTFRFDFHFFFLSNLTITSAPHVYVHVGNIHYGFKSIDRSNSAVAAALSMI